MTALEQLAAGGVVILTPDTCKRFDELIQEGIEAAVRRGIEIGRTLAVPHPDLLPYKQAKDALDIRSDNTLRKWASKGVLHIVSKGSRRYIPYADVTYFEDNKKRYLDREK